MASTLHEHFEAGLDLGPDAVALEVGGEKLSYAELDAAAGRLAARLLAMSTGPVGPVGLYASRTSSTYAGYLAILRAGGTVVPLNPDFPPARNEAIASAARLSRRLPAEDQDGLADLDGPLAADGVWWPTQRADAVAYIIFTSGSTGRPKGVPIANANVCPLITYSIERYQIGPGSRVAQPSDLTYDPSVLDIFACWGAGATLVVPQGHELLNPARFVARAEVTHWQSVPSVISLAAMSDRLKPDSMPTLRFSLFGGEQLTARQASAWAAAAPDSVIENIYGPSELTIFASAYRLPADPAAWPVTSNGTVPIGQVLPHLEQLLLGQDGRPAAGGELCVRGAQRFCGYLDPRDNAGRFLTAAGVPRDGTASPAGDDWYRTGDLVTVEDGHLVHQGRADLQVKIRGRRVELPEVETALREVDGIREAVAMRRAGRSGESELIAVCAGERPEPELLYRALKSRLGPHLVPEDFIWLDRLPLNANGKVDRRRLAELYSGQPDSSQPDSSQPKKDGQWPT